MPTTFAQFKEEVFALYQAKKIRQELDDQLVNPSPAKLRNYCLIRLSEGLPPEDIEVFQKFFDPLKREKNLEDAITKYNTGYLKALQKFALNITQDPEDRVVKLFAILVDYQPRPFRFTYDNLAQDPPSRTSEEEDSSLVGGDTVLPETVTIISEDDKKEEVDGTKTDIIIPTSEACTAHSHETFEELPHIESNNTASEAETANTEVSHKELSNIPDIKNPTNGKENHISPPSSRFLPRNKKQKLLLGGAGILTATALAIAIIDGPKDCMCWNGEHYVPVDCQDKTQRYAIIGLDQNKLAHFQKITKLDTVKLEDIDHIWYSKIDNEFEFFTESGRHPVESRRSLKATTKYIWETQIKDKSRNGSSQQFGIKQKQ